MRAGDLTNLATQGSCTQDLRRAALDILFKIAIFTVLYNLCLISKHPLWPFNVLLYAFEKNKSFVVK